MHPQFEIVTTTLGAVSIRNRQLNEIMHNPVGPWAEANALYVDQSRLRERLLEATSEPLVVFDVGLGAAANALATLHCANEVKGRPLRLISFERDLELLRFTLDHADQFAHFTGYCGIIETLLAKRHWTESGIDWQLRPGDFRTTLGSEHERPHLIYYDPYSPKVNREMWSEACFSELRSKARDSGTMLYTYTQATPVRVALLRAGFYVGVGRPTGLKEETTQASTVLKDLDFPLGSAWFKRWSNSHVQFPFESSPEEHDEIRRFVTNHVQFNA